MQAPKRGKPPRTVKTRTTRRGRLLELAEAIDRLLSLNLEFCRPWVLGELEPDSPANLKYLEESRLFELEMEQAKVALAQLKQQIREALWDVVAFVEESEAVDIMSVEDRFFVSVKRDPWTSRVYSDEFEAYRDRIKEIAALLRVRAAKLRADVPPATPEAQGGETRKSRTAAENARKKAFKSKHGTLFNIMRDKWREFEKAERYKNNSKIADAVAEYIKGLKGEKWNDEEKMSIESATFSKLIYNQHRTNFKKPHKP